jgi:hypothetical protein
MGYRPQTRSSRSYGRGHERSQRERARAKKEKHRSTAKALQEERGAATPEEIADRTIASLRRLGAQKFAVSPFSQYFNDWLVNLKDVIAQFDSSFGASVDERFNKECSETLSKVERELEERRRVEADLGKKIGHLSDANHLLGQIDLEYAAKTREIGPKRNAEIQRLTRNVRSLEEELDRVGKLKTSIFGLSKKAKAQKESEIAQKLDNAKKELESAVQNFAVEQEKLHDDYEKKKQDVIAQIQNLEKEIETLEIDGSVEARHDASETLVEAVNAFLQRKTISTQPKNEK